MVAAAAFEAAFWTCSLRKNSVVNSCWAFAKLAPVLRYIRWICHEENAQMRVSKHNFITIWTQFKTTTVFVRKKNNSLNLTLCVGDMWNSKCLKDGRNACHMTTEFVHSHSDTRFSLKLCVWDVWNCTFMPLLPYILSWYCNQPQEWQYKLLYSVGLPLISEADPYKLLPQNTKQ